MTVRDEQRAAFLKSQGWPLDACTLLADDASFRRYFRLRDGWRRAILMDAPPEKEATAPFVSIAEILHKIELSAPEIAAWDKEGGFLLLEDLGDDTFTNVLRQGGNEPTLYAQALEVLIALHRRFSSDQTSDVPVYTDQVFVDEAFLFTDWYLPAVTGSPTPEPVRDAFCSAWTAVLPKARNVPESLVLRDYHVDNLMWLPDRDGPRCVGLLDFQDALVGPITYDLASLFEDARRDVSQDTADKLLDRYLDLFPDLDHEDFRASYAILAAQRSTKILGIFTRLAHRDGKARYLEHIPRLWRWIEVGLTHPMLGPVHAWFEAHVPSEIRKSPEAADR